MIDFFSQPAQSGFDKSPWDTSYMYSNPNYAASGAGANSGNFQGLAANVNRFMTQQAINPYIANLPGYSGMVGQRSANTSQQLKGQLPADVIRQIQQQAAERGIATGSPGSDNSNAAYLRALGLNSLGMMQQGSQNLTQSIADTPVPQLFNPASLIVPQMQAGQEMAAAQAGVRSGGGGYSITGMPNLSAPRATPSASNIDIQQGYLNSPTFTNGMWTGGQAAYAPTASNYTNPSNTLVNDWWSDYGVPQTSTQYSGWNYNTPMSPASDQYGGSNADFGQFNDEDQWWAAQTNTTLDASNPYTMFE